MSYYSQNVDLPRNSLEIGNLGNFRFHYDFDCDLFVRWYMNGKLNFAESAGSDGLS